MKKYLYIFLFSLVAIAATAQNDSVIERNVTVEREFQPVIQSAGKINVQPQLYEAETTPAAVTYSTYSNPLKTDFNLSPLGYAEVKFTHPRPLNGFLQGAIGHSATRFDFNYRVSEKKDIRLDLYAHHLGQWGRKTMSDSRLGFDFSKLFSGADLYFGVNARNVFFTRYGRYFDYTDSVKMTGKFVNLDSFSQFAEADKGNQWEVNTKIGVRSLPNQDIQYKVQTGYEAFIMTKSIAEHAINTQAMLDWHSEEHHVGADLQVQNHLYSADLSDHDWGTRKDTTISNYHAIKIEPYYAYASRRFNIHAGVNVDFCIGKGKLILPSPNVTFEAKLTDNWLALYGGAVGDYLTSSVREHFDLLRYLHPENEVTTMQNRTYVPVDAFLGFKMRPQANLLIDIYAHYILTKYQIYLMPDSLGYFNLNGGDNYRWKIGGKINYHYKDIVNISLNGYYAIGTMIADSANMAMLNLIEQLPDGHILDTPTWGLNFRVDAKINSKISLYSDNYFSGGKYMLTVPQRNEAGELVLEAVQAKPVIDLNIGAQYNINKWLSCYLQLNNYIHRKHDCFYGYQSQGINFLAGVTWSF